MFLINCFEPHITETSFLIMLGGRRSKVKVSGLNNVISLLPQKLPNHNIIDVLSFKRWSVCLRRILSHNCFGDQLVKGQGRTLTLTYLPTYVSIFKLNFGNFTFSLSEEHPLPSLIMSFWPIFLIKIFKI